MNNITEKSSEEKKWERDRVTVRVPMECLLSFKQTCVFLEVNGWRTRDFLETKLDDLISFFF